MDTKKEVVIGKAENICQTRYIFTAELPVIDLRDGSTLFHLTIESFPDNDYSWLCYPPSNTFRTKRRFSNDVELVEAIEKILSDCMVEWDKDKQQTLDIVKYWK